MEPTNTPPTPAPVAPEPAAPVAPVEAPTPAPEAALTPEQTEANEWGDAEKQIFPGLKKPGDDDTTTTTTAAPEVTTTTTVAPDTTTTTTVAIDPNETPEQKAEREAAEAAAATPPPTFDQAKHDARVNSRAYAEQVKVTATDVKSKMFAKSPETLVDGDGDPINSIADVAGRLINPVTNEPFTDTEAGEWLASAQTKFNRAKDAESKEIDRIAEVNVDLKDQADFINHKYGDMLKANTALRDRLWAQYERTLVKDAESGVVTDMPVSLEEFYDIACAPYAEAPVTPTTTPETTVAPEQTPEQKAEADRAAEAAKQAERADRSDIFGGANPDNAIDDDTKEWLDAEKVVFGPALNGRKKK